MNDDVRKNNQDAIILLMFGGIIAAILIWQRYGIDLFKYWVIFHKYFYMGILSIPDEVRKVAFVYTDILHYLGDLVDIKYPKIDVYKNSVNVIETFKESKFKDLYENTKMIDFINRMTFAILSPIYFFLCYICIRTVINKKFLKRKFSLNTLSIEQSKVWPEILPCVFDQDEMISVKDPSQGWYRQAHKPFDICTNNNLFDFRTEINKSNFFFKRKKFSLNYERTYNYFSRQLGNRFEGFDKLDITKKCLVAVICSKITESKEEHTDFMIHANKAYSSIKKIKKTGYFSKNKTLIDTNHEKEVLKERAIFHKKVEAYISKLCKTNDVEIKQVLKQHYYEYTVIMRLLEIARQSGVLAPANMLWVKRENTELYFVISQVGRKAAFTEISGIWSHFLVEKSTGKALQDPNVGEAVIGLDKFLIGHFEAYESKLFVPET